MGRAKRVNSRRIFTRKRQCSCYEPCVKWLTRCPTADRKPRLPKTPTLHFGIEADSVTALPLRRGFLLVVFFVNSIVSHAASSPNYIIIIYILLVIISWSIYITGFLLTVKNRIRLSVILLIILL